MENKNIINLQNKRKARQISQYEVGDIVGSYTTRYLYVGKFYRHYKETFLPDPKLFQPVIPDPSELECILRIEKFKKPKEVHLLIEERMYDIVDNKVIIKLNTCAEQNFKNRKPKKRFIYGHIDIDAADIWSQINKINSESKCTTDNISYSNSPDTKYTDDEVIDMFRNHTKRIGPDEGIKYILV